MRAVRMLAGLELRRRWRSIVLVIVVVGLIGAVVLATAAGARRSATALDRFNEFSRPATLQIEGELTSDQVREFQRVPGVLGVALLDGYVVRVNGQITVQIGAQTDGAFGTVVDRDRVLEGRSADPDAPHEITISEGLAASTGLGLGDHLNAMSLTPEQTAKASAGENPGAPQGPPLALEIVGIVRRPLDLGDRAASGGVVILTRAFSDEYRARIGVYSQVLRVRTTTAPGDVERISVAAQHIFGESPKFRLTDTANETHGAQDAVDVITIALWVFCLVAALAGVVVIAIVLTREISLARTEQSTLRYLGMSRPQRAMTNAPTVLVIAAGGVAIAIVSAVLASPLLPVGIARRADTDTGFHLDWTVMLLGGLGIAAWVLVVAGRAAWRTSHALSPEAVARRASHARTSVIANATRRLPPVLGNGTRLALERGSDERTVPVASAILGTALGVLGVTAVLVFASSLNQVSETPQQYGWTWDVAAPDVTFTDPCTTQDFGLSAVPGVSDVAALCYEPVRVKDRAVTGWFFTHVRGAVDPKVLDGRAPAGAKEVALGSETMRSLDKRIGDSVEISGPEGRATYRIVGRVVLPRVFAFDLQPLADGAAFAGSAFEAIKGTPASGVVRYLVARIAPDADLPTVIARINKNSAFNPPPEQNFGNDSGAKGAVAPPEIDRVRRVDWITPVLVGLLTVLAVIAVAHAIVTSVRRRRREFALLKTLGFRRSQLRLTVGWQATTLAIAGLVVGLPLGLLVGRLAWRFVAEGLGVSLDVSVPWPSVFAVGVGAIVIVNLIALLPASSAAAVRPATALRTE